MHCLVEQFIGRDHLGSGLKAQGKEEGIVHAPPVLHRQAVGGHEEGRARGDLEGERKKGCDDRGPVLGAEAIPADPLPDGVGELGVDQIGRQRAQGAEVTARGPLG